MKKDSSYLKEYFRNEAKRIGDDLISCAERDHKAVCWSTLGLDDKRAVVRTRTESLYRGTGGIALFLLELFQTTREQRYLDYGIDGIRWTEEFCAETKSDSYSFYTGRMGVAFVLSRAYQILHDRSFLTTALDIAGQSRSFILSSDVKDDFIGGAAGTLVVLTLLHHVTQEDYLLELMNLCVERLLSNAQIAKRGIYWNRSHDFNYGLCGLGHGAAEVSYSLLEIGRYINNRALIYAGEQGLYYETSRFNRAIQNWPDLRNEIFSKESFESHAKAFQEGRTDFFTRGRDNISWCNGASGIGLSRIRAHEITGDATYLADVRRSLRKTIATLDRLEDLHTYTLCHGGAGYAELFINAAQHVQDQALFAKAFDLMEKALADRQRKGLFPSGLLGSGPSVEDKGLFLGTSGIGYTMLRLCDDQRVPSILMPHLSDPHSRLNQHIGYPFLSLSLDEVKKLLIRKSFPRTLFLLDNLGNRDKDTFTRAIRKDYSRADYRTAARCARKVLDTKSIRARDQLKEIFALELQKQSMDVKMMSHSYQYIKEKIQMLKATYSPSPTAAFAISDDVSILRTRWDWDVRGKKDLATNLSAPPSSFFVLLRLRWSEVEEYSVSAFTFRILEILSEPATVAKLERELSKQLGSVSAQKTLEVRNRIEAQLEELVKAGFVEPRKTEDGSLASGTGA